MCKKIRYEKEAAEALAKELRRKAKKVFGNTDRQEKRAYKCPKCKAYHLTSMPQHEWDRIQKEKKLNKKPG